MSRTEAKLEWSLNETSKQALLIISLQGSPSPPLKIGYSTSGVEKLLLTTGRVRAAMQPEAGPSKLVIHQQLVADIVRHPKVQFSRDGMTGDPVLHILDPRYGWLHYRLSREEAKHLADELHNNAIAPAELAPTKPN